MARPGAGRQLLAGAAVLGCFAVAAAAYAEVDLGGFERIGEIGVPATGREVGLPLPERAKAADLRVVLSGQLECSYNGRSYDALHTAGDTGKFDRRHSYVRWSPEDMELVASDPGRHVYVLRLARGPGKPPRSVSAWVDIDRFVTDLIITPSEVRASLSSTLRLELWRASGRGIPAAVILGGIAGLIGVVAVVGVRRRNRRRTADVTRLVRRIESKYQSALQAVRARRQGAVELEMQLDQLRDGARELGQQIVAFRDAAATVDQRRLEEEIAQAERQLEQADRDDLRQEIGAALAAKRKLHDLLADTAANEASYLLRLSKIESALDATTVWVTEQAGRLADERADDKAIGTLQQELRSLDEAIDELKFLASPGSSGQGSSAGGESRSQA